MWRGRVLGRDKDEAGLPIGKRDDNPILDLKMCDAEFPDSYACVVTANHIAVLSQVDEQGQQFQIMEETLDCGFNNDTVKPAKGFIRS